MSINNIKKYLYVLVTVAISLFFLKIAYENLYWDYLIGQLPEISKIFLALSILTLITAYFLRIKRWQSILKGQLSTPALEKITPPYFISFALNNLLPLRAGDIYRSCSLLRLNASIPLVASTIIVERVFDLIILLFSFVALIILFKIHTTDLVLKVWDFIFYISIATLSITIFFIFFSHKKFKIRLLQSFKNLFEYIFKKVWEISSGDNLLAILSYSLLAWSFEALSYYFVALSVPSISNSISSFFAFSVGTLSTLIPSSPGYVGTFDFFTIHAMELLGNNYQSSAIFSLLIHFVLWLPITLIGFLFLITQILREKIEK